MSADCTCPWVDPSLWTIYGSAVEPGSTQEFDPDCPAHGDHAEDCPDCGTPRHVAEWDWEVDVSRDGPDGPEWQIAILDCGHYVTTGRKRAQ